jgi:DNA repair exonuclease SbcCD nuclease subunit
MRLVHLSDLHLGFRQFQRSTPAGINQREADVAGSFKRAIDKTIALAPELVLIGGDVFHTVRPTNPAILFAFAQFSRLREALPNAAIIMVAGNHDTPRTLETACILRLFAPLGIHVVDSAARRIELPEFGVSVLAVPDLPNGLPALTPTPGARYNVLLLHGEVQGVLPDYARHTDRSTVEVPRDELTPERWDYVALGHYHVYRKVGTNAYYSGSIDYTSADPWGEMREERQAGLHDELGGGKGLIEHDLDTQAHTFHPLPVSRPLVDLRPIDAVGMSVSELDAVIQQRVDGCPGGIDDKIVRLVVRDIPRHVTRELDHKVLRDFKRRALHFHFDPRKPDIVRRSASGAPVRRPSLADTVRDKLTSRVLPADLPRDEFVALGLKYLADADALALAVPTLSAATMDGDGRTGTSSASDDGGEAGA